MEASARDNAKIKIIRLSKATDFLFEIKRLIANNIISDIEVNNAT